MKGRALPMIFSPSTCPDQRRGLPPSTWFGRQASVLRILLGIGGGLKDYDRRRRRIANPPKPTARSEKAEGSGTGPVASLIEEIIS